MSLIEFEPRVPERGMPLRCEEGANWGFGCSSSCVALSLPSLPPLLDRNLVEDGADIRMEDRALSKGPRK